MRAGREGRGAAERGGRGGGNRTVFPCPRPGFLSISMWKCPRSYHHRVTWTSPGLQPEGKTWDLCPPLPSSCRLCPSRVSAAGGTPLVLNTSQEDEHH